jgi:YCII-related domain
MKFILISRHTGGREIPENQNAQMLKDLGEWIALLKADIALPINGGKSITSRNVEEYAGEVRGVIIFEAENIDQAVALAKKSPGLKYGWTHDVFPGMPLGSSANR